MRLVVVSVLVVVERSVVVEPLMPVELEPIEPELPLAVEPVEPEPVVLLPVEGLAPMLDVPLPEPVVLEPLADGELLDELLSVEPEALVPDALVPEPLAPMVDVLPEVLGLAVAAPLVPWADCLSVDVRAPPGLPVLAPVCATATPPKARAAAAARAVIVVLIMS